MEDVINFHLPLVMTVKIWDWARNDILSKPWVFCAKKNEKHDEYFESDHVPVWESQNKRITSVLRDLSGLLCIIYQDYTAK